MLQSPAQGHDALYYATREIYGRSSYLGGEPLANVPESVEIPTVFPLIFDEIAD